MARPTELAIYDRNRDSASASRKFLKSQQLRMQQ